MNYRCTLPTVVPQILTHSWLSPFAPPTREFSLRVVVPHCGIQYIRLCRAMAVDIDQSPKRLDGLRLLSYPTLTECKRKTGRKEVAVPY